MNSSSVACWIVSVVVYFCGKGRRVMVNHRFSQLVTLAVTLQWVKVKLDMDC